VTRSAARGCAGSCLLPAALELLTTRNYRRRAGELPTEHGPVNPPATKEARESSICFFLRNIIPVWVPGKVPRFPKGRFLSHQDGFQYQPGSVWQSQTPAARPADEELCSPTSDHTQSSLDTFQRPLSLSVSINGNSLIRVL